MFVTRAHHAEVVAQLRAERDRALADCLTHIKYNQTLVQQIVDMRRTGFDKAPERPALPERKADPVTDAIALAAKNDAALRRHLGAFAKAQRAEGVDDDAIVSKILHWDEEDDAA